MHELVPTQWWRPTHLCSIGANFPVGAKICSKNWPLLLFQFKIVYVEFNLANNFRLTNYEMYKEKFERWRHSSGQSQHPIGDPTQTWQRIRIIRTGNSKGHLRKQFHKFHPLLPKLLYARKEVVNKQWNFRA
jgi:hypothetical protein